MKKHLLGLALGLAALVPAAYSTPVAFNVTATAAAGGFGYNKGEAYTFVFTLGDGFTNTGLNAFNLSSNTWNQNVLGDDRIWSTLGGSGLKGIYSNPVSATSAYIQNVASNLLVLNASTNSGIVDVGLLTEDGFNLLRTVHANVRLSDSSFNFTGFYTDPSAYFNDYAGVYAASGDLTLITVSTGVELFFTATGLTITGATIPEPSTYAAIFGAVVLGFGIYSRRRQARA